MLFWVHKGVIDGYDDLAADRFVNPSAGAFSYHKGHHFIASRTITAGEEIFAGSNNCVASIIIVP